MNESELFARIEAELPQLQGWCSAEKAAKMARIILDHQPALCVEIGVFGGSSLVPQLMAVKHLGRGKVVGIDAWSLDVALEEMQEEIHTNWWSTAVDLEEVYRGCLGHLTRLELLDHCELVRTKSEEAVGRFADGTIGLLHIDGNHSEALSFRDARLYLPKVARGGHVFFDDASWVEKSVMTTHEALNHLLENGFEIIDKTGDCLVLRKKESQEDEPAPCCWRERSASGRHLCHSPKYVAPPNPVTLSFCEACIYRNHPAEGTPHPAPPAIPKMIDLLPRANEAMRSVGPWAGLPPAFCITCRQTPERTSHAVRHFRERGFGVQFFPGIHGPTFGLRTVLLANAEYRIPAGHVGLILSHYMLWQTLTFLPHDEVLILEDDAYFAPDFPERFREAYAQLPADWDFVFVGSVGTDEKARTQVAPGICTADVPFGTHAYLVRKAALPLLLETNHEARTHIDIQIAENSLPHLKYYVFFPSLVGQHSADGTCPTTTSIADGTES